MKRIGTVLHTAGYGGKNMMLDIFQHVKALLIFIANSVSIGNRLLHSLKEMFGADEHNLNLSIRAEFVESVSPASMQCPCKPLIVMCCLHWRPEGI